MFISLVKKVCSSSRSQRLLSEKLCPLINRLYDRIDFIYDIGPGECLTLTKGVLLLSRAVFVLMIYFLAWVTLIFFKKPSF